MPLRFRLLAGVLVAALAPMLGGSALAQQSPEDVPPHNLTSFAPVDFPTPNRYRDADGSPGRAYWQNEADYRIDVALDTATNRVTGTETITYTNNAPEALERLWVQLEQNYFKTGSRGNAAVSADARFGGFFEEAGYDLSNLRIQRDGETATPDTLVDGTRMRVSLDAPLASGDSLQLSFDFEYTLPKDGADRHGWMDMEDGTVYQFAQWYPRMYVYDDVHGWNPLPYLGQGEYYLEYGTFNVNITVPRDMIVGGTGRLQNPDEVLTDTQRDRLADARESRESVMIIDSTEVGRPDTRPDGEGPLTWRYEADRVRDFAWAASQAFIWDAARADAGDRTVLAQSLYPKEGLGTDQEPGWERSTAYTQHSIEFYSDFVTPYPYPNAINVAGRAQGMEYPQIVFCDVNSRGRSLFQVTDHEFGHTWFPMVVGSDERRWVWMDEGLNTFINQYSALDFYGQGRVPPAKVMGGLSNYVTKQMDSPFGDQPIMTYADRIRDDALGFLAYLKPGYGLMVLREHVLGPERFDSAFKEYVDRWAYKHPKPADFFRTMEDVSGEDLDWFWRSWFYETDALDPAVDSVATGDTTMVTISQNKELMLPVTVQLTHADGSTEQRRVPAEAFYTQDTNTLRVTDGPLQKVTIDPNQILPDMNRGNNTWTPSDAVESSSTGSSSSSDR
ncbi:M1 family metallopeptidase [Salinibacter altiplanensis]|uniref:M1 family metallopeptidase n=1 Tax=Salinibacter altiplanensis TaxID=1803181 RepID=UPI000C9F7BC8|nr:M1 family metallopeptidase [Salinibacter altiplanensis]